MESQRGSEQEPVEPSYDRLAWGRETIVLVGILVVVGLAVPAWWFLDISGYASGETDLFGYVRFEKYVERREGEEASYRRIHAELFPGWLVAAGQGSEAWKSERGRRAFEAFWNGLPDERLRQLGEQIWRVVASGEAVARQEELFGLADRWNARLEALDQPYFVRLGISGRRDFAFVYGGFYRRQAEPTLSVGDETYRLLVVSRIDRTNLREMYLGASRDDAKYAFVIVDRVSDFARQDVLPVVAAGVDGVTVDLDPVSAAMGGRVRAALREALGEGTYGRLEQVARAHVRLKGAVDAIRERGSCSDFRIADPSWNGYPSRTIEELQGYARRDAGSACPSVTKKEVEAIREATAELRTDGARRAFEAAVARVSRGAAIHEIRHRADAARAGGGRDGPPCKGCAKPYHPSVRSELSAYAASLAWAEAPVLPLFQGCVGSESSGAHGRALEVLTGELGMSCESAPPEDLRGRAQEVEASLFAHAAEIAVAEGYPERVAVGESGD